MDQPVRLVSEQEGAIVRLSVVGEAATACDVSYALQVESGPAGRSNRSVQRGKASLLPGRKDMLARVSVGSATGAWNARLTVTSCDGRRYELNASDAG